MLIQPNTLLVVERAEVDAPQTENVIPYNDLGGVEPELRKIREMIELPLSHPEIFEQLGMQPPKGVLLYGPPGCGKTLLARAIAHETNANFIYVSGPEIIQKLYGESEARLRKIFDDAAKRAPTIIFFDEIDSLAPKRDRVEGEVEKRVVAQLLSLMDGLQARGDGIVMAATNRPDSIDLALRRPGRFDREIAIGVPNAHGRAGDSGNLFALHAGRTGCRSCGIGRGHSRLHRRGSRRTLPRGGDGFIAATIAGTRTGGRPGATRHTGGNGGYHGGLYGGSRGGQPSGLRELAVEVPNVRWDDVGGLEEIKAALQEAISWPLEQPGLFEQAGLRPPRGILLYGPPGNGKTLIVKALASQSNLNFISIKGPELLSKYVGELERAVRELFVRARQVAPCIVFLDEVDALVPKRGLHDSSPVTDRVVSQLLTEIDGVEVLKDVWIIAATNRRDIVDEALLRPGRLDYQLEVPKPNLSARAAILTVHLRAKPVHEAVDIALLAEQTDGLSAAEVRFVCDRAAMNAIRRIFPASAVTIAEVSDLRIWQDDFDAALVAQRAKLSSADRPKRSTTVRQRTFDSTVRQPILRQRAGQHLLPLLDVGLERNRPIRQTGHRVKELAIPIVSANCLRPRPVSAPSRR